MKLVRAFPILLVSLLSIDCSHKKSAFESPSISITNNQFDLHLPKDMSKALKKLNNRFTAWKTTDYASYVRKEVLSSHDLRRAPFALVFDINRDGILDVVIDGHDDKSAILICIYSTPKGFTAVELINSELFSPKSIENYDDGKQDFGIPYFLWPPNLTADKPQPSTFSVAYPQPLDKFGKECGDASLIDYSFKNGSIVEETAM